MERDIVLCLDEGFENRFIRAVSTLSSIAEADRRRIGAGISISYRTVFPVIQSYGAGEPAPYWVFQRHAAYPLQGSQFVYAIIAVAKRTGDISSQVDLVVTVERASGLARFGLTREAKEQSAFRF